MTEYNDILVDFGGNDFLKPYFDREMCANVQSFSDPLRAAVLVTSAAAGQSQKDFKRLCDEQRLPLLTIHCPHIVGTGMIGLPRYIAERIYRGTYVNIKGNEARISVIHATDVAKAALIAAGTEGRMVLTDGTDPTINQLADALASRIQDKRIFTIKASWARWCLGRKFYRTMLEHHTEEDTFHLHFPDFQPAEVTYYLRNHVYDESSL